MGGTATTEYISRQVVEAAAVVNRPLSPGTLPLGAS